MIARSGDARIDEQQVEPSAGDARGQRLELAHIVHVELLDLDAAGLLGQGRKFRRFRRLARGGDDLPATTCKLAGQAKAQSARCPDQKYRLAVAHQSLLGRGSTSTLHCVVRWRNASNTGGMSSRWITSVTMARWVSASLSSASAQTSKSRRS